MQLGWVEHEGRPVLKPVVWTWRFVAVGAGVLVAGVGADMTIQVIARGGASIGWGTFAMIGAWATMLALAWHGTTKAARRGAACEVDRTAGVVRSPMLDWETPIGSVRQVWHVDATLERAGTRRRSESCDLWIVTQDATRRVATHFWPSAVGKRLARELGVEYRRARFDEWVAFLERGGDFAPRAGDEEGVEA